MAAGSAIATALIALVTGLPAWHDGRAMAQDSPVVSELAPTGRLRVLRKILAASRTQNRPSVGPENSLLTVP
jgi:hypothetical protein